MVLASALMRGIHPHENTPNGRCSEGEYQPSVHLFGGQLIRNWVIPEKIHTSHRGNFHCPDGGTLFLIIVSVLGHLKGGGSTSTTIVFYLLI